MTSPDTPGRKPNPMEDFRREISNHVACRPDGRILLTATLRDRYHDILLEVVVRRDSLVVEGALAEFRACPTGNCPDACSQLKGLIGVTIGKGLNRTLTEILGGEKGCGNLRTLLFGLLPLALNARAAAGFDNEQKMLDSISSLLTGTCAGYPRGAEPGGNGQASGIALA